MRYEHAKEYLMAHVLPYPSAFVRDIYGYKHVCEWSYVGNVGFLYVSYEMAREGRDLHPVIRTYNGDASFREWVMSQLESGRLSLEYMKQCTTQEALGTKLLEEFESSRVR